MELELQAAAAAQRSDLGSSSEGGGGGSRNDLAEYDEEEEEEEEDAGAAAAAEAAAAQVSSWQGAGSVATGPFCSESLENLVKSDACRGGWRTKVFFFFFLQTRRTSPPYRLLVEAVRDKMNGAVHFVKYPVACLLSHLWKETKRTHLSSLEK